MRRLFENKKGQFILGGIALLAILLIAAVAVILISCDMGMIRTRCELYFMNDAETSIEAEIREIKYSDPNRLPENVVIQLMKGPEEARHKRIINRQTKLLHMSNDNGKINVDLTSDFLGSDSARNMQAVYSIVKSLCSVEGTKGVKVTVQGEGIPTPDGGTVGYMTAEDINLSTDPYTSETKIISLYFPGREDKRLHKTTKSVRVADQQPIEYYIVSGLIKGPAEKELASVIPSKTALISVDTQEDICFVNLSSGFLDPNIGDKAEPVVYSIVNSLTELGHINRIQFLIEGKKVHKFGSMDIYGIFTRNESIIG